MADEKTPVELKVDEISKQVDDLEQTVNKLIRDSANDRKDFAHMKISLAGILQTLKEIVDMRATKDEKQLETIVSEVEKVVDQVPGKARQGVREYITRVKPKVVKLVEKPKKKFWLF